MAEYTVDTLVYLYDSLNNQIEAAQSDLNDFMQIGFSPTTKKEAIDLICAKKKKDLKSFIACEMMLKSCLLDF